MYLIKSMEFILLLPILQNESYERSIFCDIMASGYDKEKQEAEE